MARKKEMTAISKFISDMKKRYNIDIFTASAKKMYLDIEKKQIIEAHKARNFLGGGNDAIQKAAEEYYNEKYKQ